MAVPVNPDPYPLAPDTGEETLVTLPGTYFTMEIYDLGEIWTGLRGSVSGTGTQFPPVRAESGTCA